MVLFFNLFLKTNCTTMGAKNWIKTNVDLGGTVDTFCSFLHFKSVILLGVAIPIGVDREAGRRCNALNPNFLNFIKKSKFFSNYGSDSQPFCA